MTSHRVHNRTPSGRASREQGTSSRPAPGASSAAAARLQREIAMLDFGARTARANALFRTGAAAFVIFAPLAMSFAGSGFHTVALIYAGFAGVGLVIFVEATFRQHRIARQEAEFTASLVAVVANALAITDMAEAA